MKLSPLPETKQLQIGGVKSVALFSQTRIWTDDDDDDNDDDDDDDDTTFEVSKLVLKRE